MRAFLLFLSRQDAFKNFILKFGFFRRTAWRFVAGETLEDVIRVVREINRAGMRGSLDLLGENVHSRDDALAARSEVLGMLDAIDREKVDCNVSIKLTQLGLDLDLDFCLENLLCILMQARAHGNFVRVDMEDSNYTQRTLDLVAKARREFENVGAVVQAYLYRSERDIRDLIAARTRVRLCKGAYLEPDTVAFKDKRDTDSNFIHLMKLLLASDTYHAIATHDEAMIRASKQFAQEKNISKDRFEFQMLYGVRRDLQQRLTREGYHMRVYIPFGRSWYPYFMRRLAERPANVMFVLRNLLRD